MSRILPGSIGLLTVPVVVIVGLVQLPMGSFSLPPGLVVVAALAGVAAWIARGGAAGWLGYGLGLAIGTLGVLVVIGAFASSMTVENWLVSVDVFRVNLALTVLLITAAAAIGYGAGMLLVSRFGRSVPDARPASLMVALPVVVMAVLALGYPWVVPEAALLPAGAPTVTVTVAADGRLTVEPTVFRAGPAVWRINSEFDKPVALVMVPVMTDADLERLRAGDQQGFALLEFDTAQPGPGSRRRFDTEPARYAIYVDEATEGKSDPGVLRPIPPERLAVVDVRP